MSAVRVCGDEEAMVDLLRGDGEWRGCWGRGWMRSGGFAVYLSALRLGPVWPVCISIYSKPSRWSLVTIAARVVTFSLAKMRRI